MKPDWILIANAAHARLLAHEPGSPMVALRSFEHAPSRARVGDLAADHAGHGSSDVAYGGAPFNPRVDAKAKEHMHFARELTGYLETNAQQHAFARLSVFASSPFLGVIKAEFGDATRRALSGTHDLDLTSFGLAEVEQRVLHELAHAPR